jgi:glycine cleavage system H protein
MPESLTFLMGKHPAPLPGDRRYCKNHMWCLSTGEKAFRFGFSAYAVRLMQDVYFLEWSVDAGTAVGARQPIGFLESSKAQSELYAPVGGTITAFNTALLNDPSAVNADGYGAGWLFDLAGQADGTLSAAEYHEFLVGAWATAQKLIKGQINSAADE